MTKTPRPQPPRNKPKAPSAQPRRPAGATSGTRHPHLHEDFQPFHSAVNRIPVPRDKTIGSARRGALSRDLFGEHAAPTLDHLREDTCSGSIDLCMTVHTPLVFGEQHENDVSLPRDAEENVVLPPTMVKGMVSRAYEILTASRFRVFDGHAEPLTYRADPAMVNGLVPGRILRTSFTTSDGQEHARYEVEILDGESECNGEPKKNGARMALLLDKESDEFVEGGLELLRRATPHGKQVTVGLSKRGAQLFVTHVIDPVSGQITQVLSLKTKTTKGKPQPPHEWGEVTGYPCRTAPDEASASDLFEEKRYERFFFKAISVNPVKKQASGGRRALTEDHLSAYTRVLDSYVSQHEEPGQGKHLLNRAALNSSRDLGDGDLVFVRLDDDGDVAEILPTMVGRRSYEASPRELAARQRVLPVARADEASSADRLFGYVVDAPDEGASGGDVAARGRLFFGAVDTSGVTVSTDAKTLEPLLSPKPSSARRFLTDVQPKKKGEARARRGDYFRAGQRLGAAAYPVHRTALDEPFPTEATKRATSTPGEDNAATRLTAKDWVATGSVMRTRVRFEGLSKDELAALLWVLTPENLVPAGDERKPGRVGYLRMGLGKPLGLGVVEVRATGLHLIRSQDLASAYEGLSGALGTAETDEVPSAFPMPFKADVLPWVRAMQRAAYGYDDCVPVSYMSLDENKVNNQTDKTGAVKNDCGLAPRPLELEQDKQSPLKVPRPKKNT